MPNDPGADFFRSQHNELTQLQANEIALVKAHAQQIIDRVSCCYADMSEEGQAKICTGTMHLETAIMWLVKGLSAEVQA